MLLNFKLLAMISFGLKVQDSFKELLNNPAGITARE